MPSVRDAGEPIAPLAERFVTWVCDGRGDVARGRNLFALRLLDALWDPAGAVSLPYRPTRAPAAFLVMLVDLVGDAAHGYGAMIDDGGLSRHDAIDVVRRHVASRLDAPWTALVDEVRSLGLPHLASVTVETVTEALHRPAVSDLPELLASLPSWMTPRQLAAFDVDDYVVALPLVRVLALLRFDETPRRGAAREQHPSGGDLRALIRRRIDPAWCRALVAASAAASVTASVTASPRDLIAFAATWPLDAAALADASDDASDDDFAVAYALATDAPHLGRAWDAPPPFVRDEEREAFEALAGRGSQHAPERRSLRLRRWGVSATLPASVACLDGRLETMAGLEPLHAGGSWRAAIRPSRDTLAVERRRFLQQVAETIEPERGS